MFDDKKIFHLLNLSNKVKIPKKIEYPFQYTPTKISKLASEELQKYLESQQKFQSCFDKLGKMFGVLIVENKNGKIGYLAAFSGKINESVIINGFVPPIYNSVNPKSFFKIGEQKLNKINKKIKDFEKNSYYLLLKKRILNLKNEKEKEIIKKQLKNKKEKNHRKKLRLVANSKFTNDKLIDFLKNLKKESIRQNYELKDLKKNWKNKINLIENELLTLEKPLQELKKYRKNFSAELQKKLHKSYKFLNSKGIEKNLITIFEEIEFVLPSGTGECCAPKLFQYAFKNNLKPISMAEFWWGKTPPSEIKTHKKYYPACKGKCKPILNWMLKDLNVKSNPVKNRKNIKLDIKYEDEHLLVINKPYRFLSVPGREIKDSVYTRIKNKYPNATGPLMVHRLDMGTSGLLVIAKKAEIHKNIQQQFIKRTVQKRYIAILDGIVKKDSGEINLPLRVDYNNRPRQLVCFKKGKPSITFFKVIERKNNKTKIYLYPKTGRTHQLRVHCAHYLGLNSIIYGDDLYGISKDRLYLHAEKLEFTHPTDNKHLSFFCESNFNI